MRSSPAEARHPDPLVGEIVLLLRKIVYAPDGSITPHTRLDELGMDSLDLIEAGLELEALLGRDMPEDALRNVQTVGDIARCFERAGAAHRLSLAA